MKSEVFNMDNMELMAKYPDGYFELAIVLYKGVLYTRVCL